MNAWFRANRWYLAALAVVLPAAFIVSLIPRWFPYQAQVPIPLAVPLGETVRYSGADITLDALDLLPGARVNAPEGSDVVVASFTIDVVEESEGRCEIHIVSDEGGFERRWDSELYSSSDYEVPDRFESSCLLGDAGSYELQMTFLVPEGEVQEPVVDLMSTAALPRVLRLS